MNISKSLLQIGAAVSIAALATSCSTTYDHYGRPVQTVDPALAVAGVAAAGILGYALANDRGHRGHRHHRGHRGYDRGRGHHGHGGYYGHGYRY
ncbi:hypothetical protein BH23VER1_BH23VER1_13620 [soil metagenome]